MLRYAILIIFILTSHFSFGQLEILKGNWISKDNELIAISDTTNSDNQLISKDKSNNFYLEVTNDTLSFQDRFSTSADDYKKLNIVKYDLKIEQINDSILIAKPVSKASKKFFSTDKPIVFSNQEYIQDSTFNFTKLVFHTSTCYGSCPVIHLEISSDGSIKFSGNYFKDESFHEIDSARSGNFTGKLSEKDYTELIDLIIESKITTLNDTEGSILCCDGAIKTIILYHNGTRKYYQVMFETRLLKELISYLYAIDRKVDLTEVDENFKFEQ